MQSISTHAGHEHHRIDVGPREMPIECDLEYVRAKDSMTKHFMFMNMDKMVGGQFNRGPCESEVRSSRLKFSPDRHVKNELTRQPRSKANTRINERHNDHRKPIQPMQSESTNPKWMFWTAAAQRAPGTDVTQAHFKLK